MPFEYPLNGQEFLLLSHKVKTHELNKKYKISENVLLRVWSIEVL